MHDRATWKRISTPHKSGNNKNMSRCNTYRTYVWLDRARGDIKEKGRSGEEVYDRATWRRISTPIKVGI